MKETIYTIPINEAFEKRCGCPLCTLRRKLEHDSLDYILGAAMMEPDVRTETNKSGFCAQHYSVMIGMNSGRATSHSRWPLLCSIYSVKVMRSSFSSMT